MDLDAEIDQLYSVPLDDFISCRNELTRGLKSAGQKRDAEKLARMLKPTVAAWAVNQLSREHSETMSELAHLAEPDGGSFDVTSWRQVGTRRMELVAMLTRAAGDLLERVGHAAAPATLHKITMTLQGATPDALIEGRFTKDLEPTGLQGWGETIAPVEESAAPSQDVRARRRAEELDEAARTAERNANDLDRAARRAMEEAKSAEADAAKARREAVRARERADAALQKLR
ncbi:MAG: hypothetical protein QOG54_440 [Actinomycetota bacterium]|nr:hypothetical protein [Actinomycetota bacterium]